MQQFLFMKVRTAKRNKINVVTLGCAKNIFDSEVLMSQLKANDFDVEHEREDGAQIVIVNTCGFIDNAKEESVDAIVQYAEAKNEGLIEKLYVTGCLSERYAEDLKSELPEVDAFFGTRQLPNILKTLNADYKSELLGERVLTTPSHYAYFKISEGCDRPCSFCAIPLMRGKHRSTPIEELVKRAENLAAKGVKELILIAQDSTYYGLDLYQERKLAELLNALSEVEGIEWLRLHYAFPNGFPLDVIDVIRDNPKVCSYIDIPLQHINNEILKSMKRGTSYEKTTTLLRKFRTEVPDIAIRTTLIAGYPGETQEQFEELCEWVEEMKFDRLGVFEYSHEENTTAYELEDDVHPTIKRERVEHIMNIQRGISYDLNQARVGKTYRVLFDRVEGDHFIGRTEFDSVEVDNEVLVPASDVYVRIGDFANVKITSASDFDLFGEVVP